MFGFWDVGVGFVVFFTCEKCQIWSGARDCPCFIRFENTYFDIWLCTYVAIHNGADESIDNIHEQPATASRSTNPCLCRNTGG